MNPLESNNLDLIKNRIGLGATAPLEKTARDLAADKSHGEAADRKRWKAALDFESMFLTQMYKGMRQSTQAGDNEFTKASPGRDIWTGMLDNAYAGMNAKNPLIAGDQGMQNAISGISNSLAAQIYRSLSRQEGETGVKAPPAPAGLPIPRFDESASNGENMFSTAPILARLINAQARSGRPTAVPPLSKDALEPLVDHASRTYDVPANLIKSVIKAESNGQPLAVSGAGAKGLMQLMDTTAGDMGVRNVFNPAENVLGGTRYLKLLLDRFGGDEKKALAAYNAGPATVDRFNGVPPYQETKAYVERVLKHKQSLDAAGAVAAAADGAGD